MNITKLLSKRSDKPMENKIPTIAFLGDSVTQGCFELVEVGNSCDTVFDRENAYSNHVSKILALLYPRTQINIINAGISGDSALGGLSRIERDVIAYSPDLTVVCFGLNDSGGGIENIDRYKDALDKIFTKLEAIGSEIIFMTPNMMCEHGSPYNRSEISKKLSDRFSEIQNGGVLDAYVDAAKAVANSHGIPVCDVYAKWKLLSQNGVNVTELLSNKLNHPTREMQKLFAYSLVETMMN